MSPCADSHISKAFEIGSRPGTLSPIDVAHGMRLRCVISEVWHRRDVSRRPIRLEGDDDELARHACRLLRERTHLCGQLAILGLAGASTRLCVGDHGNVHPTVASGMIHARFHLQGSTGPVRSISLPHLCLIHPSVHPLVGSFDVHIVLIARGPPVVEAGLIHDHSSVCRRPITRGQLFSFPGFDWRIR